MLHVWLPRAMRVVGWLIRTHSIKQVNRGSSIFNLSTGDLLGLRQSVSHPTDVLVGALHVVDVVYRVLQVLQGTLLWC